MDPMIIAAIVIAAAAALIDMRTGRIPDVLTLGAVCVAVAVQSLVSGAAGATQVIAGMLVGAALLWPFNALGGLGGGDVKLLAAVGAWIGVEPVMWVAGYTALIGGAMALLIAATHHRVRATLANLLRILAHWRHHGLRRVPGLTLEDAEGPRLAYAVAILGGVIAVGLGG